jgi:hypothetical protein
MQCFAMTNDDERVRFIFNLLHAAIAKKNPENPESKILP